MWRFFSPRRTRRPCPLYRRKVVRGDQPLPVRLPRSRRAFRPCVGIRRRRERSQRNGAACLRNHYSLSFSQPAIILPFKIRFHHNDLFSMPWHCGGGEWAGMEWGVWSFPSSVFWWFIVSFFLFFVFFFSPCLFFLFNCFCVFRLSLRVCSPVALPFFVFFGFFWFFFSFFLFCFFFWGCVVWWWGGEVSEPPHECSHS